METTMAIYVLHGTQRPAMFSTQTPDPNEFQTTSLVPQSQARLTINPKPKTLNPFRASVFRELGPKLLRV